MRRLPSSHPPPKRGHRRSTRRPRRNLRARLDRVGARGYYRWRRGGLRPLGPCRTRSESSITSTEQGRRPILARMPRAGRLVKQSDDEQKQIEGAASCPDRPHVATGTALGRTPPWAARALHKELSDGPRARKRRKPSRSTGFREVRERRFSNAGGRP